MRIRLCANEGNAAASAARTALRRKIAAHGHEASGDGVATSKGPTPETERTPPRQRSPRQSSLPIPVTVIRPAPHFASPPSCTVAETSSAAPDATSHLTRSQRPHEATVVALLVTFTPSVIVVAIGLGRRNRRSVPPASSCKNEYERSGSSPS